MTVIHNIQIISVALGLISAAIVLLSRRFGFASWLLGLYLAGSAGMSGILLLPAFFGAQEELVFRLAITILLFAVTIGLVFVWSVNRRDLREALASKKGLIVGFFLVVAILTVLLYLIEPPVFEDQVPKEFISLGPGGYLSSLYLLVISIIALSSLEQIVRSVEERVKWEIKFLVLGLAANYSAIIYLASKALLYSFQFALLPKDSFYAFTLVFPISCILVLLSWKRNKAWTRITVSHSLIYSSITLLSVGVYLMASAILARLVSSYGALGFQTEAAIFILSIVILAAILMGTTFRHHAREWIRRNIFAGKYDYRQLWMEANQKVRSVDGVEKSAQALAGIVQQTLGAIDVGVWLRLWNPDRLQFLCALGLRAASLEREVTGIVGQFVHSAGPIRVEDIQPRFNDDSIKSFIQKTNAAMIVPLSSSDRIVGILTVGSNRSGHSYGRETREFLRVLGSHAASEFHKHELLTTLLATKESEAFESFSTFLLHDLKNFASTLSLIAANAAHHQENPDFQRDAFQSVYETAEKMKRLCNNLRTFSRNLAANRTWADLNKIVNDAMAGLNPGMSRQLDLKLAELPPVFVDEDEVTRVLQNLVLNAREATSPQGSIIITTRHMDNTVELAVQDNGMGMPKEFMEKELFLPFRTTKSDGLGIGLFQSKKIIDAHGGSISIDSVAGKGTIVRVRFPDRRRKLNSEEAGRAERD
jgi:putative PEP-CTERM system histidine kinase